MPNQFGALARSFLVSRVYVLYAVCLGEIPSNALNVRWCTRGVGGAEICCSTEWSYRKQVGMAATVVATHHVAYICVDFISCYYEV